MGAVDELIGKWRANPDADATVALCSFLSTTAGMEDLIREVGTNAQTWHLDDPQVMLAVGRMFLDSQLLPEAQAALVSAGKADGRDARAFRYLGEVLLRRGDAMRAEKVLARAIQLGSQDADTQLWHERATVYVALQKRVGIQAVAAEVARTLPKKNSIPPPTVTPRAGSLSDEVTNPRGNALSFDDPTTVMDSAANWQLDKHPSAHPVARAPVASPPDALPKAPKVPAGLGVSSAAAATHGSKAPGPRPLSAPPPLPGFFEPASPPKSTPPPLPKSTPPPLPELSALGGAAQSVEAHSPRPAQPTPAPLPPIDLPGGNGMHSLSDGQPTLELSPAIRAQLAPQVPAFAQAPAPTASPAPFVPDPRRQEPTIPGRAALQVEIDDSASVTAEHVLEHLALVGVYEKGGGAPPAWERPPKEKSRGVWTLAILAFLVGVGGSGGFVYTQKVRAEKAAQAEALTSEVSSMLHDGKLDDLAASDGKLNAVFELDSRNQKAARLWLENRVLNALMGPGEAPGIDAAIHRARSVEVPEEQLAFGQVASFMAEGDLAGAAALLSKWDKKVAQDPMYQLTAGAALDLAGDNRAFERYQAAVKLDPDLIPAQVFLSTLALIELGPEQAKPVVDEALKRLDDRPSGKALVALRWVAEGAEGDLPAKAKLSEEEREKLPASLRSIPLLVDSLTSQDPKDSREKLKSAIGISRGPAIATWLGFVAVRNGDEELSRKAALRALKFSAIYPRARALAARVALLGGRLDEAKKAIETLDPKSSEVAVVRAVIGYETLDEGELSAALSTFGDEAKGGTTLKGLQTGLARLRGEPIPPDEQLKELAQPQAIWGNLVAVDYALDSGKLELAQELTKDWDSLTAAQALRRARLLRYQGQAKEAAEAAGKAEGATVPALLERCYDLLAAKDADGARNLAARYPTLLGPMNDWLKALIDAEDGKASLAAAKLSTLDEPPDVAPLPVRLLAARALAASGDKRAKGYVAALMKKHGNHPDVVIAAKAIGILR
ncbi:MAG: hypothetical protein R3B07_33100 [Polyangiaceae bacterium]